MARRLAVARHAGGFDAIGWVLLGFVLGAGLAVFVLLHADVLLRPPPEPLAAPTPAASVILPQSPPAQAPASLASQGLPPPETFAPPPAVLSSGPAVTLQAVSAPAPGALARAGAASARGVHAEAPPQGAPKPRPSASSDPEVADDAAAAGMTSRTGGQDLY